MPHHPHAAPKAAPIDVADPAADPWSEGRGLLLQYAALFLAPAAFFTHLQLGYVLVPWSCEHRNTLWIHVVSGLAVLMAAAGVVVSWQVWRRSGEGVPDDAQAPLSRVRLVAIMGGAVSLLFVFLLLAQWTPAFVLTPCQ